MKDLARDARPTVRKALNRGHEPIRWRSDEGAFNGWIEKRGTKWMTCYFPSLGRKKLPLSEERYMTKLPKAAG